MKHYKTEIPLYQGRLALMITNNWQGFLDYYNEGEPMQSQDESDLYAHAFCTDNSDYIIVLNPDFTHSHNTIVHEIEHIKNYIFRDRGIKPCYKDDEADAYLIGWIAQTIYDWLKEAGLYKTL